MEVTTKMQVLLPPPIRSFWYRIEKRFRRLVASLYWPSPGLSGVFSPVPARWLKLIATMVDKSDAAQQHCWSLKVDIEKTKLYLGWMPQISLSEVLRRAAGNAE